MNNEAFLNTASKYSEAINNAFDKTLAGRYNADLLAESIELGVSRVTVVAIREYANSNEIAKTEYINFFMSVLEKLVDDEEKISFVVDAESRYKIASTVMAYVYIYSAYLLKIEDTAQAEKVLTQKFRDKMKEHYISRAVFTLSARANLTRERKGWAIRIAIETYDKKKAIRNFFFSNGEQFKDLVCQVDFLQYYFEYRTSHDLYHGYPNFLFYNRERAEPLIQTLKKSDPEIGNLVKNVANISAGDFFVSNQWNN